MIDLRHLPPVAPPLRSTIWWGVMLLVAIESAEYGALITSYYYLRLGEERWPPEPIPMPDWVIPGIAVLAFLASAAVLRWTTVSLRAGNHRNVRLSLALALLLALVYPLGTAYSLFDLTYTWSSNAYGSISWTLNGFGLLHGIALLGIGSTLLLLSFRGWLKPTSLEPVQAVGLYWAFNAIASLLVFLTLYVSPYVLHPPR